MKERRVLCLWFPNWPIQRLVVAEPDLRKKHIVLFRRDPRKGQLVAAASPLAMRDGAQVDMPVSEVKQLLRHSGRKHQTYRPNHRMHPRDQHRELAKQAIESTCLGNVSQNDDVTPEKSRANREKGDEHTFYILENDPIADREAIEKLVDSLHCFSPIVGIEQTDAPESCFLDVTGLGALFGDEASLRARATRFLHDAGYTVFSAIANTPGMAWGMAHYHRSAAPSTCEAVSDETLRNDFRKLPVSSLRLSDGTQSTLARLGIERVDQLLAIPRTHLASRFGDEVSGRIDQAFGRVEEPIVARHLPAEFEASQFLEFPTRDRETIGVILSRLLEKICEQLVAKQKGALQWRVQLDCLEAPSIEFEVNLFQPTATVLHVMQLVELQLESVLKPHLRRKRLRKKVKQAGLGKDKWTSLENETTAQRVSEEQNAHSRADASGCDSANVMSEKTALSFPRFSHSRTVTSIQIQEITVRVTSCVLLVHRQRELFDESPRLDKQELAYLINHLTSRLGQESIVYPTLQSGAQPELSFRYKPLVDPKRMRSRKRENVKAYSHRQARPLRLLDPPVSIANGQTALPFRFRHQGISHQIVAQWGPERIETSWWRGPTIRRDYWRVESETGQHFWVYFDLRRQHWFLQGEF